MFDIKIDKVHYKVNKDLTIMQACKVVGIEIPKFCYHESLSIAGNCRICLVEVEKSMKPVAACAMPLMNNMEIKTNTFLVRKAREGVIEMLLVNHPLDCPICDQGGECDLQDQVMLFGNDRGRFYENKRAVVDKNCGPFVKTVMTRCIHCTRCVRFLTELGGVESFGLTGRGNSMEIGTYISNYLISELSSNIIDICPVGALTAKPSAFLGRSWELKDIETLDLFDVMGTRVGVSLRGNKIMRIIPLSVESVNEDWITDKVRFAYDGFMVQRLMRPLSRVEGSLLEVSWEEALLSLVRKYDEFGSFEFVGGSFLDLEGLISMKDFFNRLGEENYGCLSNVSNVDFRSTYLLNSGFDKLDSVDSCLIVGVVMRYEVPLLAMKLRREHFDNNLFIAEIGSGYSLGCDSWHLGHGSNALLALVEGRLSVCSFLVKSKKTVVYFGDTIFNSLDGVRVLDNFIEVGQKFGLVCHNWFGFNYIGRNTNYVSFYELGVCKRFGRTLLEKSILYVAGEDNFELDSEKYGYVVYQGSQGDISVEKANLVLPSLLYLEKEGLYVSGEGRVQLSKFGVKVRGNGRNDWKIFKVLEELFIEVSLHRYCDLQEVRARIEQVTKLLVNSLLFSTINKVFSLEKISNVKLGEFSSYFSNFYMCDSITRSSKNMSVARKKLGIYRNNYRWS